MIKISKIPETLSNKSVVFNVHLEINGLDLGDAFIKMKCIDERHADWLISDLRNCIDIDYV